MKFDIIVLFNAVIAVIYTIILIVACLFFLKRCDRLVQIAFYKSLRMGTHKEKKDGECGTATTTINKTNITRIGTENKEKRNLPRSYHTYNLQRTSTVMTSSFDVNSSLLQGNFDGASQPLLQAVRREQKTSPYSSSTSVIHIMGDSDHQSALDNHEIIDNSKNNSSGGQALGMSTHTPRETSDAESSIGTTSNIIITPREERLSYLCLPWHDPYLGVSAEFIASPKIFLRDSICRFFLLVNLFLLTRVINTLSVTVTGNRGFMAKSADGINPEYDQMNMTVFLSVSVYLYYLIPIALMNAFATTMEVIHKPARITVVATYVIFVFFSAAFWITIIMNAMHTGKNTAEWLGFAMCTIYAISFLLAAIFFPRRLYEYGALDEIATRMRKTSICVAVCFCFRLALVQPNAQQFVVDGVGERCFLLIYSPFDIIPTVATLFFLRRGADGDSGKKNDDGFA